MRERATLIGANLEIGNRPLEARVRGPARGPLGRMKPGPSRRGRSCSWQCWIASERLPIAVRALAGALGVSACRVGGSGLIHLPSLETIARDIGAALGLVHLRGGRRDGLSRDGAGIGLVAPGEAVVVIGGVTAGQGHTNLAVLIGVVWACAFTGDLTSYSLGRRLGRRLPAQARAPGQAHARPPWAGGEVSQTPRVQDHHRRSLHRAGASARTVRGRLLADACRPLPPGDVRRGRNLVGSFLEPGLPLLAIVRAGRGDRPAGYVRVRRTRHRDRRGGGRLPDASHARTDASACATSYDAAKRRSLSPDAPERADMGARPHGQAGPQPVGSAKPR